MGWPQADIDFMQAALAEAEQAGDEVPVGAIVVSNGDIIGRGHNVSVAARDPSGHAEIVALRAAASSKNNHRLNQATLYVTLEPCVMCMGAIAEARIARLVFGAYDERYGAAGSVVDLSDGAATKHRFEVNGGLLKSPCAALLQSFFETRR